MNRLSKKKRLILVIDDDDSVREVMMQMLSLIGSLECVGANNAPSALDVLLSRDVDALVMDILSCGAAALELYRKAVVFKPSLEGRVVFVSGRNLDTELENFCLKEGLPFLNKPFKIDDFIAAVTGLLDPRRGRSSDGSPRN